MRRNRRQVVRGLPGTVASSGRGAFQKEVAVHAKNMNRRMMLSVAEVGGSMFIKHMQAPLEPNTSCSVKASAKPQGVKALVK